MTVKDSIKNLLDSLNMEGYDRKAVAEELGYSEKTLAPLLSKGGNERFVKILQILLRKIKLEQQLAATNSNNPIEEVALKIKKHLDALNEQADAMKKIIDANISSDDPRKKFQQALKKAGERKPRFPRERDQPFDDKSKVQDPPHGQDSTPAKGKENKGSGKH